ncbi:putative cucumisin [Lupinus albus]|uniref:Putative cucumisin n=1 Tax=Lupinus albus TaxID=3870 RepID=A0A6A4PWA3_LUPAL|nr:putative cucumisin [Lupinus albus]
MAPIFLIFSFFIATLSPLPTSSSSLDSETKTFIIQVQHEAKPSVFPTHKHWYQSSLSSIITQGLDTNPRDIIHTYDTVFHGFSVKLTPLEAHKLQSLSHVITIIPEQVRHLHTTRSPHFLGLKTADRTGLLHETDFGSDLVIGVIDTGIWPERQSFNDRDLGPVPAKWKGECVAGKDFLASSCNRKLIGARYFYGGYEASDGKMNDTIEYRSPRDSDGHGTHTASIAAGRLGNGMEEGDGYSSSLCLEGSLDPKIVRGKIVVCDRGINSRAAKGEVVKKSGGVAMILANGVFDGEGLVADCHVLPATAVGARGGDEIRRYISLAAKSKSGSVPTATIVFKGTRLGVRPAPVVASFSARGPNPVSPEILKPDIIAPGLNILAAWPDRIGPSGVPSDGRRTEFNILSGTSMACPHVSGLAALLKAAHPDWSPAAIRSALMTTAYTVDNRGHPMLDESTGNVSSVFDYGAGHVHPEKALDPGLIYDISSFDYVDFLCNSNYTTKNIQVVTRMKVVDCSGAKKAGHSGNLNYPSLSAVFQQYGKHKMSTHFIRTVTNVGDPNSVYKVTIKPPTGMVVTVEPETLSFRRVGQKLNFLVRVQAREIKLSPGSSNVKSGSIVWSDGKHNVTSPLVVTMQQPLDD